MKSLFLSVTLIVLLLLLPFTVLAEENFSPSTVNPTGASAEALSLAQSISKKTLSAFGLKIIHNTVTYKGMVNKLGADKADKLIDEAMEVFAPQYLSRWENALAAAHMRLLTDAEMKQITEKTYTPEVKAKYGTIQKEMGQRLMKQSLPLLKEFSAAVLTQAFAKAE
jgi:hypothetical protein